MDCHLFSTSFSNISRTALRVVTDIIDLDSSGHRKHFAANPLVRLRPASQNRTDFGTRKDDTVSVRRGQSVWSMQRSDEFVTWMVIIKRWDDQCRCAPNQVISFWRSYPHTLSLSLSRSIGSTDLSESKNVSNSDLFLWFITTDFMYSTGTITIWQIDFWCMIQSQISSSIQD